MDQRQKRFEGMLAAGQPPEPEMVTCPTCEGLGYIPREDAINPFQFAPAPALPALDRQEAKMAPPPDYSIDYGKQPVEKMPPSQFKPPKDAKPIPPKKR
jgi:hypothetical protein|tara:strand:- start:1400 stop:1696 length:297 start_codon:yes stop_codon:yes gene_type:complete